MRCFYRRFPSRLSASRCIAHKGQTSRCASYPAARSTQNSRMKLFAHLTNQTRCFKNNGAAPELVFQQAGRVRSVSNAKLFELLSQKAQS